MEQMYQHLIRSNDVSDSRETFIDDLANILPDINFNFVNYNCFYIKRNDDFKFDYSVTLDHYGGNLDDDGDFFDNLIPEENCEFKIACINTEIANMPNEMDSPKLDTSVVEFFVTFEFASTFIWAEFHIEQSMNCARRTVFFNSNTFGKLGAKFNSEGGKIHDYFIPEIPEGNDLFMSSKRKVDSILDIFGVLECMSVGVDIANGFSFDQCIKNMKRNRFVFDEEKITKNRYLAEEKDLDEERHLRDD